MAVIFARYAAPLGEIFLASDGSALCGAWFADQKHFPDMTGWEERQDGVIELAGKELNRYFAGELRRFSVPLRPIGTIFQQKIWSHIAEIAYGSLSSYGELAAKLGSGPRAVGAATARNPLSIFVPCHRMVGGDGSITGYAGGLDKKTALLALEGIEVKDGKAGRPRRK